MHPDDRVIAALASDPHGLVTRAALLEAGFGRRAIAHRLERGRLHPVFRGIYSVGRPATDPAARRLAAVLACGPGASLSHLSAAVHWRMLSDDGGLIHVTITGPHRRGPQGVRVHETKHLDPADIRTRSGVPLTSPLRTLHDLAATDHPGLEIALNEAQALRLVTAQELGTAGRRIQKLLEDTPGFTRSEAERRLKSLLLKAQLPPAIHNARVEGHEVDALWPHHRLVLEVDGYAAHGHRAAFERDRQRDQQLTAAGYRVIRVTWRQLTATPEAVAARLGAILASGTEVPGQAHARR